MPDYIPRDFIDALDKEDYLKKKRQTEIVSNIFNTFACEVNGRHEILTEHWGEPQTINCQKI